MRCAGVAAGSSGGSTAWQRRRGKMETERVGKSEQGCKALFVEKLCSLTGVGAAAVAAVAAAEEEEEEEEDEEGG